MRPLPPGTWPGVQPAGSLVGRWPKLLPLFMNHAPHLHKGPFEAHSASLWKLGLLSCRGCGHQLWVLSPDALGPGSRREWEVSCVPHAPEGSLGRVPEAGTLPDPDSGRSLMRLGPRSSHDIHQIQVSVGARPGPRCSWRPCPHPQVTKDRPRGRWRRRCSGQLVCR